mmetsp:Transcript_32805/g.72229  ORF Transcript_32805/g.72229 Transcript_32805/m.72229 type:complete len:214 (-) Transcript_32805:924-1565(-)|eukprot:CAMPEP_0173244576 /NCGR_PEP_ID=MMETSP1142-20121109/16182_1 /TAXON_ID=483371 /ORGANISM="non described non described, Strain CCMP2298" /LENGTH=213 /DNA_ID=CAMNT_0014176391 /DNA_START=33 /DNA_END=674 /DNA_ORIENTATION=+
MSGRKQKTNKGAEKRAPKYASKQVALVLDKLIEQRIQTSKYPQKTSKWMAKMRSSVLAKVSAQSKVLFQPGEQTAESVKQEIAELTAAIKDQRDELQNIMETEAEAASAAIAKKPAASAPTYESGFFDETGNKIKLQYIEIANSLSALAQEVQPCVTTLGNNLDVVNSHLQPLLEGLDKVDKGSPSSGRGARKSGAVARGQPLQQLQKHLSKK